MSSFSPRPLLRLTLVPLSLLLCLSGSAKAQQVNETSPVQGVESYEEHDSAQEREIARPRSERRATTAGAPGANEELHDELGDRREPELAPVQRQRDRRPPAAHATERAEPLQDDGSRSPFGAADGRTRGSADRDDFEPRSPTYFDPNAQENSPGRRIQLFLVPLGSKVGTVAKAAQVALESELARLPGFTPVDLVSELTAPASPEELDQVAAAKRHTADGDSLMAAHDYVEASHRYQRARQALSASGIALEVADYVAISAKLGTALVLSGEERAGRMALLDAVRNDPSDKFSPPDLPSQGQRALNQARAALRQSPTGAVSVITSPAGSRVFTAGVYRGTTPLTLDSLPVGPILLRLDRPGAYPWVQIIETRPGRDTPVKVRMSFTPEARELQRMLVELPRDLKRGSGIPEIASELGRRFRLHRGVVATAQMNSQRSAGVRLVIFDYDRGLRLADESASFTVQSEEQLQSEIARWAREILDRAEDGGERNAADPLDRIDGTEGWYSGVQSSDDDEDEKDSKKKDEKKRRGGDPLRRVDGTEDW